MSSATQRQHAVGSPTAKSDKSQNSSSDSASVAEGTFFFARETFRPVSERESAERIFFFFPVKWLRFSVFCYLFFALVTPFGWMSKVLREENLLKTPERTKLC